MNIFFLDRDPVIAAQMQTSKHVCKMIIESGQLLSTAHRFLDKEYAPTGLYKATHINHPCSIWTRTSSGNYEWLYFHFISLCQEYTKRYKKNHLTLIKLSYIVFKLPRNINIGSMTEIPLVMPDAYKMNDPVESYRLYYKEEKIHLEEDLVRFNLYTK